MRRGAVNYRDWSPYSFILCSLTVKEAHHVWLALHPLLWLLGLLLLTGSALGAYLVVVAPAGPYWPYHPKSTASDDKPGDPKGSADSQCCTTGDQLLLDDPQRKFLWEVEHGGNLLVNFGFKPLAAALKSADEPALLAMFSADFHGEMLRQPREAAWRSDWMTVVRQMKDDAQSPLPLNRNQFVAASF